MANMHHHLHKSAVAEYGINICYRIPLNGFIILAKQSRHMNRIIGEVIEIQFHPNNINRGDEFVILQQVTKTCERTQEETSPSSPVP
jgi:hypothetical protein